MYVCMPVCMYMHMCPVYVCTIYAVIHVHLSLCMCTSTIVVRIVGHIALQKMYNLSIIIKFTSVRSIVGYMVVKKLCSNLCKHGG